jgi:hypothetical protein
MLSGMVAPLSASTTVAQSSASSPALVTGTVYDSRGVAQGGAAVVLTGHGPGQTTSTSNDGRFTFTVSPGIYSISINKGGFQTYRSDNVVAVGGQTSDATYSLTDATTATLQTIGGTSTTASRTPINRDIVARSTFSSDEILSNPTPEPRGPHQSTAGHHAHARQSVDAGLLLDSRIDRQ